MEPLGSAHGLAPLVIVLAISAGRASAIWTYRVTWPEGEVTSYTYPRTSHGDCLYDRPRDRLICMRNHGYQSVVNTWVYDPELILYVSVRCLAPHPYPHHLSPLSPSCLCKTQRDAAISSSQLTTETFQRCQLTELRASALENLDNLEALDLSFNHLHRLTPVTFDQLAALKVLSLAVNPIRHLPEGLLCPLAALEVLDVSRMQLALFPGQAFRCDGNDSVSSPVRWMDASGNRLNELQPSSLWYMSHLTFLNLSDNLLQRLPSYPLLGASALSALDLAQNLLRELPQFFCEDAEGLSRLSLRNNTFVTLSLSELNTCRNLTHLELADNMLSSLPGPPASLPSLRYLGLSRNKLESLESPLIEAGECSLLALDLSHNDLTRVSEGGLGAMRTLVRLNLRGNALTESSVDLSKAFLGLSKLQALDLSNNHFSLVRGDHFAGLTALLTLDLSGNEIGGVTFALNTSLTRLTHLDLSGNRLASFPPRAALALTRLRVLDLSDNLLHEVSELHVPSTLLSLDISRNMVQSVPRVHGARAMQQLLLTFNSITQVLKEDFQDLPGLKNLNLAHNSLSDMHPDALSPIPRLQTLQLAHNRLPVNGSLASSLFSGLRVLRTLNLSHNDLSDVRVLFQPGSLTSLVTLDVSFNSVARISERLNQWNQTMHLEHLHVEGCRLRDISEDAFDHLIYLRSVNLQHNRLTRLPLFRTHPGIKYHLRGNPLTCSCRAGWLKSGAVLVLGQAVSTHDYDVRTCRTLPRGHLRPVRDVPRRDFLCVTDSPRCPPNCTCYSQREAGDPEVVFCAGGATAVPARVPPTTRVLSVEGGWLGKVWEIVGEEGMPLRIEELYLNNSWITELSPFVVENLPSLRLLQLANNHLVSLPAQLLDTAANLTSLSLRGNRLTGELTPGLFAKVPKLENLDLSRNSLTHLPRRTVHELARLDSLARLQLAGNPWQCACGNADLFGWLRANRSRAADLDATYCGDDPRGRRLADADESRFDCRDEGGGGDEGMSRATVGVVFIGLPLLGALAALAYKFRRVLAAVLYARLGLLCVKRDCGFIPPGLRYDISVLYDHADRKCVWWVDRILLPRLASAGRGGLRVHVPRVGERVPAASGGSGGRAAVAVAAAVAVVDSAVYSVRQSAVCLVLVSKYFGAHQHTVTCLAEVLQQAQSRPRSLVLVTWGELTKQTLECGVRPFLGRGQHLPVTAPFFWDRLLSLLPVPGRLSSSSSSSASASRRRSLVIGCRFRSVSDVSAVSDAEKPEAPPPPGNDVTHHL